ncbi:hypothetical protein PV08_02603 [Exophiala spinifera]|uniref:AttH domain-containing protein n=1 Tax=Exophiala spinifera TaxID=91928 RepID=A0A0D2BI64_9EURO|nr:uncharacterized protein PV08_02603 [Exophiala spinifera]KIW18315.1 hypothetical protein PV08_02603 [Exophiala spinifera]
MARTALTLCCLVAAVYAVAVQNERRQNGYYFKPELATSYWNDSGLPILFNFSDSQFSNTVDGDPAGSSYWTSSSITGTNGQQYLAVSHALIFNGANNETFYRASVLPLSRPEDYSSFIVSTNESALAAGSQLKVTVDGNGFQGLTEDNVSQMRTYSNHDKVTFDITYNATSPALVDAAVGLFTFGTGVSYEWGLPNCYTEGALLVDGSSVTIDPANSFTWYDRQWNNGIPSTGNWTWFELHIPHTGYRLSVWAVDNAQPYQRLRFATI